MNWKKLFITFLRVAIGWHFLYEGFSKLIADNWSAAAFLRNSSGPLADFYQWMGESDALMNVIDPANVMALVLVGIALFIGIAIRFSSVIGILLLFLYYFAYPPFGISLMEQSEGTLYIVNRNMIEALALLSLLFIKEKGYGIYALKTISFIRKRDNKETLETTDMSSRREALKNLATLPVLGLLSWGAVTENKKYGTDTLSGATIKFPGTDIRKLEGELPKGKIKDHEVSRLVLGGNLIGGWAHSRDLHYVPALFRAYNTEAKIFETLQLAEEAGINSINIGFPTSKTMQKYKKVTGSKMKVICQVAHDRQDKNHILQIQKAIDLGADILQVQGNSTDVLVRANRLDVIDKMMTEIRRQGYTAGLGAHAIEAHIRCHEEGLFPDYYMKTMHHDHYWSAHPKENRHSFEVMSGRKGDHNMWHDNLFCAYPEKTVDFVNNTKIPVMGFKVLAAGAIKPEDGFNWAFRNGADFICVGMFDFQVVNNVNLTIQILDHLEGRKRAWFG